MKSLIKLTLLILNFQFIAGCTSAPKASINNAKETYSGVIEPLVRHEQRYKGLTNTLDIKALWVSPLVQQSQSKLMSTIYQWSSEKQSQESLENLNSQKNKSEFIVSFYSPEKKENDLNKKETDWRFFLDYKGQRLLGKATKLKGSISDLKNLYPFHNNFSTLYSLEFPSINIPQESNAHEAITLTITGNLDSTSFQWVW